MFEGKFKLTNGDGQPERNIYFHYGIVKIPLSFASIENPFKF